MDRIEAEEVADDAEEVLRSFAEAGQTSFEKDRDEFIEYLLSKC